ncbi:hypothetical protein LINPERPRIM_LOCUS38219 [Linum perenne]
MKHIKCKSNLISLLIGTLFCSIISRLYSSFFKVERRTECKAQWDIGRRICLPRCRDFYEIRFKTKDIKPPRSVHHLQR